MDIREHQFLRVWFIAFIALATVSAGFSAAMDPYLLFNTRRIAEVNERKSAPAKFKYETFIKAYDVLRSEPNTVILGSSTVDFGLDAEYSGWPTQARPVYNLGFLGGGGPYIAYRYLQHVDAHRELSLIVVGLEFDAFLTGRFNVRTDEEFESRLSITPNGTVNPWRRLQEARDAVQATLSLDAMVDSVETLHGNLDGRLSPFNLGNAPEAVMLDFPKGFFPLATHDLFLIRVYRGQRRDPLVMPHIRAILEYCQAERTPVIFIINPAHADMLEILDLLGLWEEFENWKRELVTLMAGYSSDATKNPVTLWDFSGYNQYSTEPVPHGQQLMRWFWDTNHYRHALGNIMIDRIFGSTSTDFGTELTLANIESHLRNIREKRRVYRRDRPADVQRVRYLHASLSRLYAE